ncbi:hypothetical protein LBMAG42_19700 [Deltaproteobacteria bacterium]|nr:hypothetical protein LBMAG42_19700 [Deltaproteobacteria bacterium]
MDLVQLHTLEPLSAARLSRELASRVDERWLQPWATLDVAVSGPWRPADVWPGRLERLVWTATFVYPEGGFFTPEGELSAGALGTLARRQAPIHPAELVAGAFASALVVWHSDAGRSAYAAVWRERRLRWSLRLDESRGLVRCDGEKVISESPPRHLPEQDRTGVLLAGWQRLLGEPLPLEGHDRLLFVDTLAALTGDADPEQLYGRERAGVRAVPLRLAR